MVVDDGGEVEGDVIFCHADLTWHFNYLDLNVNLDKALRERIDLDEAGIDGTREFAELCDEADVSLGDWLVGIGADEAAWDGAEETNGGTKSVYC